MAELIRRIRKRWRKAPPPPTPDPNLTRLPLYHVSFDLHPDGLFISVGDDGVPTIHLHPGQRKAWESVARFILMLAGSQGGKTSLGPWWLLREMIEKGPGNYLLVAPTFRLLDKTAVPALNHAWNTLLGLGVVVGGASGCFRISEEGHRKLWPHLPYTPTRVVFGYGENPDSLESITAKAAWLDECGQKGFKAESHESIQARLAIHGGRIIYTSTPYVHNWLKTEVHDRAKRRIRAAKDNKPSARVDADYDCISFESRQNPAFPKGEWERQKVLLPPWRFAMRYQGKFTRPAGAVYDCFNGWAGLDDNGVMGHVVPAFNPDPSWRRFVGIDFGAPNFASIFIAEEPGFATVGPIGGRLNHVSPPVRLHIYAEYRPEEARSAGEHVRAMRALRESVEGPSPPPIAATIGGSKGETQWRLDFAAAGWPIYPPDQPEIEVGLDRGYAVIKTDRLRVCDSCVKLLAEFGSYSRPVDEAGNVLEGLEDGNIYHGMDSFRYPMSWLNRKGTPWHFEVVRATPRAAGR